MDIETSLGLHVDLRTHILGFPQFPHALTGKSRQNHGENSIFSIQ